MPLKMSNLSTGIHYVTCIKIRNKLEIIIIVAKIINVSKLYAPTNIMAYFTELVTDMHSLKSYKGD